LYLLCYLLGTQWLRTSADQFDPDNNTVTLANGQVIKYDYLVVATGMVGSFDKVKGMNSAIQADVDKPYGVCSIYDSRYVDSVRKKMCNLKNDEIVILFLFYFFPPFFKNISFISFIHIHFLFSF
jgi:hypothetical protein